MQSLNAILENLKPEQFYLISGPCVVESRSMCFRIAEHLKILSEKYTIPIIFKASYRKANRSKIDSFTGIGDDKALQILAEIQKEFALHTTTDIHSSAEAQIAAEIVDILQIPAFLSRQTDILEAAAHTGKIVNVKKGQFLSHGAMQFVLDKLKSFSSNQALLTERGNSFGYHDLIVDFIGLKQMTQFHDQVIMDCTHSVQKPNQSSGISGGKPDYIETLAKCAIVTGVQGLFIETHPDPSQAKSDGANMLKLDKLDELIDQLLKLRALQK